MNDASTSREIRALPRLPRRPRDAHKGDFGRVLVVAGSRSMPGAAILCARAALRSGAGLVTIAADERISSTLAVACPEATQLLLPADETAGLDARTSDAATFDTSAFDRALEARVPATTWSSFAAIVIGPGLGTSPGAGRLVSAALTAPCPLVVDADAINLLAARLRRGESPPTSSAPRVYTPHPGELERLSGARPRTHTARRVAATELARLLGGTVVLKGARSVVASAEEHFVNPSGNPGMATGGSGDVLAGIIAAFLAQGLPAFDSASLGVYLHGLAGDLAARTLGETSLVAGDLVEWLPRAILRRERAATPRSASRERPSSGSE